MPRSAPVPFVAWDVVSQDCHESPLSGRHTIAHKPARLARCPRVEDSQARPAEQGGDGHEVRLIADEVGVGKTIEAGLILKGLQARRGLKSLLVIGPKPLSHHGGLAVHGVGAVGFGAGALDEPPVLSFQAPSPREPHP